MTIPGSDGSEASREEEQRERHRRVNKVDCLIGRWVMNVVVIHSLKGHAALLLTCGQPWLTCCHIVWRIYSHECSWGAHGNSNVHAHKESIKAANKSLSGERRLVAVATRGQRRQRCWRAGTAGIRQVWPLPLTLLFYEETFFFL